MLPLPLPISLYICRLRTPHVIGKVGVECNSIASKEEMEDQKSDLIVFLCILDLNICIQYTRQNVM